MNILYKDEDIWLGYTKEKEYYFLHTEITSWSLSKAKKYFNVLAEVLKQIPSEKVYSLTTNKGKKFNEFFGFKELGPFDVYTIMELDNVWFK